MPSGDYLILLAVGGGFLVLGLIGILWGRYEEKSYFDSLSGKPDMREFMEHWPKRPQPGSLRTGGWIAIAAGVLMLAVGCIIWLTGSPPQ
ncbi:hypothetical protein ACFLWU_05305 [Chloroflexota bacterium]